MNRRSNCIAYVGSVFALSAAIAAPSDVTTFDDVWSHVRESFYAQDVNGADIDAIIAEFKPRIADATNADAAAGLINESLARLGASHTVFFTPRDDEYYELLSIFGMTPAVPRIAPLDDDGRVLYDTIGVDTITTAQGVFIADVLPGGPGEAAGLKRGDAILAANVGPYEDVDSLRGLAGRPLVLQIRRNRDSLERPLITVTPERIAPVDAFVRSIRASARVIESKRGGAFGYVRVYSYAGEQNHEALRAVIESEPIASCEALILDLRGGWGGASPDYLDLFNDEIPSIAFRPRGADEWTETPGRWTKPMAALIDGDTRSGKEILAHAFRTSNRATLVGERTAGAVLGGRLIPLDSGDLLYLAVLDVRIDGQRLEGVGVEPHVQVARPLEFSAGADPQLDEAVRALDRAMKRN